VNGQGRSRHGPKVALVAAAFALVAILAVLPEACRQKAKRAAPAAPPKSPASASTLPAQQPEPPAATRPIKRFSVTVPEPGLLPGGWLRIVEKFRPAQPAKVAAALQSDRMLVVKTENVRLLILDLTALPRSRPGRLILRIDGQGIEITGKAGLLIHLRRDRVGAWSVQRRGAAVR